MKITTTTAALVYSVPCGSGVLCSNTADFESSWIAGSPEADEPDGSLATDEEISEAIAGAQLEASGSKIEYFKMDAPDGEGLENADGGMWSAATRLAKITLKNGVEYYAAEDEGPATEIDDGTWEALLPFMITDETPPATLVTEAHFMAI